MISTEDVENALNYLRDSAGDYAKWKARLDYLTNRIDFIQGAKLRAIKARKMKEFVGVYEAVNAQEREAYASQEYQDAIQEMEDLTKEIEEATREAEYHRAMRAAMEAKYRCWQTQEASRR